MRPEPTPNPNAVKFTVGRPVGGPETYISGTDDPLASALLGLAGVVSVFKSADFVTITKDPASDWGSITPRAIEILEGHQG